ncbi:MAG TPA: NUDIX hydrolase [Gemmatimonadetes bacterium]|nr:NUDIX hydrolase [Gemmatimonadota bacterium]|tara:strand:- start:1444 stop:1890 length:447 start_codon:yes stop_codon:yes gene_type:complete
MSAQHVVRQERSAGGVVVRARGGVHHVLLIRDPYQNWGLPKGHLEEGEDAPTAAIREVREETGLNGLELGPEVGSIDWYFRRKEILVHKFCSFFLMHSAGGDPIPQVAEGITECGWFPIEEAMSRVIYQNARAMIQAARQHIAADIPG